MWFLPSGWLKACDKTGLENEAAVLFIRDTSHSTQDCPSRVAICLLILPAGEKLSENAHLHHQNREQGGLELCNMFKVISSHLTEILCCVLPISACRTLKKKKAMQKLLFCMVFFCFNMSLRTFLHARKCSLEEQWQCACAELQLAKFAWTPTLTSKASKCFMLSCANNAN